MEISKFLLVIVILQAISSGGLAQVRGHACAIPEKIVLAEGLLKSMADQISSAARGNKFDVEGYKALRSRLFAIPISTKDLNCVGIEASVDSKLRLRSNEHFLNRIPDSVATLFFSYLLLDSRTRPSANLLYSDLAGMDSLVAYFTLPEAGVGEYSVKSDRMEFNPDWVTSRLFPSQPSLGYLEGNQSILSGSMFAQENQQWSAWGPGFAISIHEYAHFLDMSPRSAIKVGAGFAKSKEWQDIYRESQLPSKYASTNCREDFAESVTAFFLDPAFKCYAPLQYNYISKIIMVNSKVYGGSAPYDNIDCSIPTLKVAIQMRKDYGGQPPATLSCI